MEGDPSLRHHRLAKKGSYLFATLYSYSVLTSSEHLCAILPLSQALRLVAPSIKPPTVMFPIFQHHASSSAASTPGAKVPEGWTAPAVPPEKLEEPLAEQGTAVADFSRKGLLRLEADLLFLWISEALADPNVTEAQYVARVERLDAVLNQLKAVDGESPEKHP